MRMFNVWFAVGISVVFLVWTAVRLVLAGASQEVLSVGGITLAGPLAPVWISGIIALAVRSSRAQRVLLAMLVIYGSCLTAAAALTYINPDPQAGMAFVVLLLLFSPIAIGLWIWVVLMDWRSRTSAWSA